MLDDAERLLEELLDACRTGALIASSAEVAALAGALQAVKGIKSVQ